ncbi:uncharacterized protein RAG0_16816 [Rhynchosporium agropyri]|uniref:Uncharacterized protein n=2 Tax=Rhynchosporium TaxID=38037 RepID=A0A1E1LS36_9HELO|nr:uncharacterized protein RCO7_14983 [Rhynchosporium commune]CZT13284.1 uncharacterized protein RAG0_16816 [Rhynchosporium agropyri]
MAQKRLADSVATSRHSFATPSKPLKFEKELGWQRGEGLEFKQI